MEKTNQGYWGDSDQVNVSTHFSGSGSLGLSRKRAEKWMLLFLYIWFRHFVYCICLCLMFYFVQNYYIFYGTGREPLVSLGFMAMLSCMVAIGLAIGVTIAVGGLFFIQVVISEVMNCIHGVAENNPNKNSSFLGMSQYFVAKFCTIIGKGCLH